MLEFALSNLRPDSQFVIRGQEIEWITETVPPTEAEVQAEVSRLEAEYAATEYQRLRAAEYPPMSDYLDGIVKGDQAQVDKYIVECQAVKVKYPKPEANV